LNEKTGKPVLGYCREVVFDENYPIIKDHKTVLTDVKIPFLGLSVIWILYLAIFSTVMASVLAGLMVLFGAV